MPSKPRTLAGIYRSRRHADAEYNRARRGHPDRAAQDAVISSGRWKRVRAQILRNEPLCRHCTAAGLTELATQVDHIVGLALAPDRAFDPTNLQPLCTACHARKSAAERTGQSIAIDARAGHQRGATANRGDDPEAVGGEFISHASGAYGGAWGVSKNTRVRALL